MEVEKIRENMYIVLDTEVEREKERVNERERDRGKEKEKYGDSPNHE